MRAPRISLPLVGAKARGALWWTGAGFNVQTRRWNGIGGFGRGLLALGFCSWRGVLSLRVLIQSGRARGARGDAARGGFRDSYAPASLTGRPRRIGGWGAADPAEMAVRRPLSVKRRPSDGNLETKENLPAHELNAVSLRLTAFLLVACNCKGELWWCRRAKRWVLCCGEMAPVECAAPPQNGSSSSRDTVHKQCHIAQLFRFVT